jgi:hypothetical protein
MNLSSRVAQGVALLDQVRPGWVDRIDLETLNIRNPYKCVLGQVFGNYWYAIDRFSIGLGESHGFFSFGGAEMAELTAEWRRVIAILRQKFEAPVTVETKELVHV